MNFDLEVKRTEIPVGFTIVGMHLGLEVKSLNDYCRAYMVNP